ncbi:MAG: phosphatase PAP2 family protein [DPANN group archaeon]|nr:phosphatase PAP2 family protein [DPANN group archaeon]
MEEYPKFAIMFLSATALTVILPMLFEMAVPHHNIGIIAAVIAAAVLFFMAVRLFKFDRYGFEPVSKFYRKYEYGILFIAWIFMLTSAALIGHFLNPANAFSLATPLDLKIPLLSPFVLFYLFFPFYGLSVFWYVRKDAPLLRKAAFAWLFLILISEVVYLLFPTYIVRPTIVPQNIFDKLLQLVYANAPPFCDFPSLHVSGTALSLFILYRLKKADSLIIPGILTIISTLLVKQHYIINLIGGVVLAFVVYILFFHANAQRLNNPPERRDYGR